MLRPVLAACAAVLVLSGCQSEVGTRIDVSEQVEAQITVSALFTGDAAVAMQYDPAMLTSLEDLFAERGATGVTSTSEESLVEVRGVVTYDTLLASADVTGVRAAALESLDGRARVTVTTQEPVALVDAITDQAVSMSADQADAEALTQTFLATTQVAVTVAFPGPASVSGPQDMQPFLTAEGSQVRFAAPLAELPRGSFTAEGALDTPMPWLRWIVVLLVVLIVSVVIARRRR